MTALPLLDAGSAKAAEPAPSSPRADEELQVEVTKKGLGKEVSIRKGSKEWYMMVEVTPENTVIVRQEKDRETFLVDESETHDRAMTAGEVDAAIDAFINGVKAQVKKRK
jgi:ribosomal protein L6P/L9E